VLSSASTLNKKTAVEGQHPRTGRRRRAEEADNTEGGVLKAVILAGGEGTRLRPLTLTVPKPVVPVVDRPFLRHQLDLLDSVGVQDIVFSVAYQPERVREVFGDGAALGRRIRYAVEASPLGTGGAVKNAEPFLDSTTIVMNGDILTDVDLAEVVRGHSTSGAAATLVLTPVTNPSAYGLVETDREGRVLRFIEKPDPSQITTDTINAGIYVLETATLSLIPPMVNHSIERGFFPALLARGDLVRAHVHRGYWIDIGTPEKYRQVHRDILHGRFRVTLDAAPHRGGWVHASAEISANATLCPPFFIGPGCVVGPEARIGPDAVLVRDVRVAPRALIEDALVWPGCTIGSDARVVGALLGARVDVGQSAEAGPGAVLGEGTVLSDFTRTA
jgi:NDP-sugar pyrophosphorylase family protein